MATSVLLNFSNSIVFTPTDPLMGLVRIGVQLLSYDLLSVETFTKIDGDRKKQIQKKVAELRNMLEDRCLSSEDQGESIRLIILLDFIPWGFLNSIQTDGEVSFDAAFPSLKIDLIKSIMEEVFGKSNPLLRRFDYNVIFIDDKTDEERSARYKLSAYHGYCKKGMSRLWLSADSIKLNHERDEYLRQMGNPDASMLLTDVSVKSVYDLFKEKLGETLNLITDYLQRIGKDEIFNDNIKPLLNIKTIGDFEQTNYDFQLQTIIRNIAGLGADRFRDCTFFVTSLRQSVASLQCKDGIALRSLIQLICTTDWYQQKDQYHELFKPLNDNDFHKFFIMSEPDDNHFTINALLQYRSDITAFGKQVGGHEWWNPEGKLTGLNWDSSKEIQYYVYKPKTANAAGSHEPQNDVIDEVGAEKVKRFRSVRKVPFFFGKKTNDWHWYHQIIDALNDCCKFEIKNDRPIVDNLTRESESKLPKELVTTNYGELELRIKQMAASDIVSTVDYDAYINNRKKKVEELVEKIEDLKKELVKLGFRSRALLMACLSCLVFTLCFAFHFIYSESEQYPLWLLGGLLAFCLSIIIGMIIARFVIKEKIHDVYRKIDFVFESLRQLSKSHLDSVNKLVTDINQADANRKTLSEMKMKYDEWEKHNKKVECWINYSRAMRDLLDDALKYLNAQEEEQEGQGNNLRTINETILDSRPSVVAEIWSRYRNMKPQIIVTNQNKKNTVENATSFLSSFHFTCIQR